MQFLRTAFWVILAVAIALFCKANNRPLEVKIWGDIVWETRIWFPILLAFLLGALPLWLVGRATKWRLKRKLDSTEKALATATTISVAPASSALPSVVPPAAPIVTPADPATAPVPDSLFPSAFSDKP
jgi:uncharacterized integral membrane protein